MKLLIAVPTFETIYPDTFKSIWDLELPEGVKADFDFVRGYDCARARNNIADKAIDGGYDFVLMIDNDTVVPKDALKNLMDPEEDVVLGYYAHRLFNKFDGRTNMCKLGEFNYSQQYSGDEIHEIKENRLQVHGGGLGCALIRVSLFKRFDYPYFNWVNYNTKYVLSEDLFFAEQCKRANVPIWCDTRVPCGHIFRYIQEI